MPRKIKYIAPSDLMLYAKCDDDTIWRFTDAQGWSQLPPIPQGEPEEKPAYAYDEEPLDIPF